MDNLASIGALVNEEDHVDAILDGLSEDYSALVTVITSKSIPMSVSQVEALLMAHEERLEKYRKLDDVQANMAHFSNQPQQRRFDSNLRS